MTASASRGLSFPRTKHILVDFPRFEIEANLMEVIQVIYRGRGNNNIDKEDKQIIFYLNEQAVYYLENESDRKYSLQESKLNILDFFPEIQTGYISGSLLIVSLANQKVEEVYRLKIDDKTVTLADILSDLETDTRLSETIQTSIKNALDLVKELEKQKYLNQKLEQENQYSDRFSAVPLFVFIVNETFTNYYKNKEVEPEDRRFRDLLETYVSSLFPISQVIPIGYKYEKIPFLVFRSYSLKEMRDKQFSDKYLINSKELNILNLILARF